MKKILFFLTPLVVITLMVLTVKFVMDALVEIEEE
jgi:ABC-type dipeptide/oligopeptide/nickel transport system permease subunit